MAVAGLWPFGFVEKGACIKTGLSHLLRLFLPAGQFEKLLIHLLPAATATVKMCE
jgi:hypothetical protein